MKKIALFAATEKGYASVKAVIESGHAKKIGCVITFKEDKVVKSWDSNIKKICHENEVNFFNWMEIKDRLREMFKENDITSAIAISWKYFIPLQINDILEDRLIVFHDSLLPKYRGFAPTPTAIINGDDFVGVTAIYASEDIDCGDIIKQEKIAIDNKEYIGEIIEKEIYVYSQMVVDIIEELEKGGLEAYPQDEKLATYSIWRDLEDCHIDWNQEASKVYNFIRALGTPYMGAYTYLCGEKIIIKKAKVMDYDLKFPIRNAGKVWKVADGMPVVICKQGLIGILEANHKDGTNVEFNRLRVRLS